MDMSPAMKLIMLAKKAGATDETCKMMARDFGLESPEQEDEKSVEVEIKAEKPMVDDGEQKVSYAPVKDFSAFLKKL